MMEPTGHPDLVTSPEMAVPGNLEILAQTAASQPSEDTPTFSGYPVLRIAENTHIQLPLLSQHIRIEGQPGGPMLSQAQLHKILNTSEQEKRMSPGPLSIITTTSLNEAGQPSPASISQGSHILYRTAGAAGDAMLSAINYNDSEILEGGFDVGGNLGNLDDGILAGIGNPGRLNENPSSDTYPLFDSEGESLNMDALSPHNLLMDPSGNLQSVGGVSDSGDSSVADASHTDDEKKKASGKYRSKNMKGQVSPGKVTGPLECNQCHKIFNNTSALAKHKLTHSDERKYLCTICEKKFKRQDHLNGHLMTHRDKKPYQCMVAGCEKSYCDARSLKRHLENHHQHTSEQIAVEMVAAASAAAAVLADVSNALQPQPTQKGNITNNTSSVTAVKSVPSNTVIQTSAVTAPAAPATVPSTNKVLAQQLMVTPNVNSNVPVLVSMAVSLPEGTGQNSIDSMQQTAIAQCEALLKQQEQERQLQLLQEQQGKQEVIKLEPQQLEALKQMHLKEMELQAIAAAAQLQEEQQKQQQRQALSETSVSSIHAQGTPDVQSPVSGEQSPVFREMSPVNHQATPPSPIRAQAQAWYGLTSHAGAPAPNTTVADVKAGEEQAKPVVCGICQRRFKNVPALNGHMRLHGGYFKKDAALKEEKRKKAEMAPPSSVPSKTGASAASPQAGAGKKSKGTPPLQSPPSEEVEEILQQQLKLHALHWQQKQEQQRQQQLQQELQQLQQQQIQQQLQQHAHQQQQVPKQSPPQTVQEHLKQIHQKMQQQQQEQQQQQLQQLQQQQLQAQMEQRLQQQQQEQQKQQQQPQLSQLEIIQLTQLQQGGVEPQQIEVLRQQLLQQQLNQLQQQQEQEKQQQQQQQQQMMHDNPKSGQDHYQTSPQVPQSPHLPTSPPYRHTQSVPQSPQVPQSPLMQQPGSVEAMQSPVAEYGNPMVQENLGMTQQFGEQNVQGYSGVPSGLQNSLLHSIQQQMHSQNMNINSLQSVNIDSVHNANLASSVNNTVNSHIQQIEYNQSVNPNHEQSAYQSQLSGPFMASGHLGNPEVPVSISGSNHTTSEIVSQIITSLENLGEVPLGSMNQINKDQDLHMQVYAAENIGLEQFEQHLPNVDNGVLVKNTYSEFAHNNVVHNPIASNYNSPFVSQHSSQMTDTKASVKQELLKHLQSKPTSPRAAQSLQFSFQSNSNNVSNNNSVLSQRQRHHSAKTDYTSVVQSSQHNNSELKRRLSAGLEDIRSPTQPQAVAVTELRTHIKRPAFRLSEDISKPRIRSKSGDDYRIQRWRAEQEEPFMKPKIRSEDFSHRPRSKTDEHLSKWRNREVFSRSDGAGVFRNPTSTAPGSFKMRRKNRPAPLIIPPHANHCGFQSRLRSPRIWNDGGDHASTAPVPYTPPPMLSPLRRGSGLFWSISGNHTPQPSLMNSAGLPSTPRPSLLRSASVTKSEKLEESSEETIPSSEELPPLESDILPHVNIGSQYQAVLPEFNPHKKMAVYDISKEDLVFDAACIGDNMDEDVQSYQDLACSAAVCGNGSNVEHALHLLFLANGNIQKAMLMLMSGSSRLPRNHGLTTFKYQESDVWSVDEIDRYTRAILTHDKDFFSVASDVKTKSVRQCVQFYYLWKKVLVDDNKRLRAIRRRREQDYNLRSSRQQQGIESQEMGMEDNKHSEEGQAGEEGDAREESGDDDSLSEASTSCGTFDDQNVKDLETEENIEIPLRLPSPAQNTSPLSYTCDYPECNSSFSSKAARSAHVKIHMKVTKPAPPPPRYERKPSPQRSPVHTEQQEETFPCKLCGRVFGKVKSRSAHMKIHRPDQDKEKEKKAKLAKQQAAAAAAAAVAAATSSSIDPMLVDPLSYSALPNGPSQL